MGFFSFDMPVGEDSGDSGDFLLLNFRDYGIVMAKMEIFALRSSKNAKVCWAFFFCVCFSKGYLGDGFARFWKTTVTVLVPFPPAAFQVACFVAAIPPKTMSDTSEHLCLVSPKLQNMRKEPLYHFIDLWGKTCGLISASVRSGLPRICLSPKKSYTNNPLKTAYLSKSNGILLVGQQALAIAHKKATNF